MTTLIEVKQVTKYFGGLCAINNMNCELHEGEILGLIGPNGAGKTTLFNLIAGVHRVTRGEIRFKGERIIGYKPSEIAKRGIARVYQQNILFKERTVLENLKIGYHLRLKGKFWEPFLGLSAAQEAEFEMEQKLEEILEYVELAKVKNEIAKNLPFGYQRRLGVAIALATHPKLMLLDEPFSGMTTEETDTTMALVKGLKEKGITIWLVEHDMRAVMRLCERIIVLNFGEKIAEGPCKAIMENKDVIEAYLGTESNY
jgi:branched-chain amino acid transport system ATP-binding protein